MTQKDHKDFLQYFYVIVGAGMSVSPLPFTHFYFSFRGELFF